MDQPPKLASILIVGGGPDGWLTALTLHATLVARPDIRVTILKDEGPACAPALSASPDLRRLHARIGLDDLDILASCGGSGRLGRTFTGFGTGSEGFILPHGEIGAKWGPVRYHQQLAAQGASLSDYASHSLAGAALKLGRFAPPSRDPRQFLSTLDFGFHLDGDAYVRRLRDTALARGVEVCAGRITEVEIQENRIAALIDDGGVRREADFYIDATGADARLTNALGLEREEWASDTPFRIEQTRVEPAMSDLPPATGIKATSDRWSMRIPLPDRTIIRQFSNAEPCNREDTPWTRLQPGRLLTPWSKNCLAVGTAACQPDPISDAGFALLVRTLERLPGLLPASDAMLAEARSHNRKFAQECEAARDFARLILSCQTRSEPAWQDARSVPCSNALRHAKALFDARGRAADREYDLFGETSWTAAWLGLGVRPRRHDPQADTLQPAQLAARIDQIRRLVDQTAQSLPDHRSALARLQSGARPA